MTETVSTALGNRAVLRIPEFRKLFTAQAISDVGDGMTFTALLLLVNALTGSTAALAARPRPRWTSSCARGRRRATRNRLTP